MKSKMRAYEENFGRRINHASVTEKQREDLIQELREIRGEVSEFQRELKDVRRETGE